MATRKATKVAKKSTRKTKNSHRPIWSGNITFGLINIPVTVYTIENRTDLHFRMLDSRNLSRIRYERVNETTGESVPWEDTVKGYEYDKDNYVVLNEKEIEQAAPKSTKNLEIEGFVDKESIDTIYFEKPYYLLPGKSGTKGYVLLREVLENTKKIAIGTIVIRAREHLTALIPYNDAILLNIMRFKQELKSLNEFEAPEGNLKDYKISAREVEVAEQLVDLMTTKWKPEKYHDSFREILMDIIKKKIKSKKTRHVAVASESKKEPELTTNVVDFMSLLKKSLHSKTKKKA